jgi:nucleoside-diphosphate-sugar epimerase
MRVFVTGATGFVGSAVVQELISLGHKVLGLTRSEAGAKSLVAAGAEVHRGDLDDIDSLLSGAKATDGVIHTAFNHDFSKFKASTENDKRIIVALGKVLAGSDRPLIVTSGVGILSGIKGLITENDMPMTGSHPRVASEEGVDAVALTGVRVSSMRLPPSVHGDGDHGFVPMLINIAREKGMSVYEGEGLNRWPAVHRLDAARLYRLALESSYAPGTRFHGVAEEGIPFRDIAEAIGKGLDLPVVSKSKEDAAGHFGWFAPFAEMDVHASAKQTKEDLGWHPTQPGLIRDIEESNYFNI